MLLMLKKAAFHIRFDKHWGYGEKIKTVATLCVPDVRETFFFSFFFFFFFFADNFTGSKDTEPYKADVSFLCHYINLIYKNPQ